jgi:hypothetical protein
MSVIETRRAELLERLVNLQPAVVCDVLDVMGYPHQALSSRLRLVDPKSKIAGPAFCVRGSTTVGAGIPKPASGSKPVFEKDRHLHQVRSRRGRRPRDRLRASRSLRPYHEELNSAG